MEKGLLNLYKFSNRENPIIIEYRKRRQLLQEVMNDIFNKELDSFYDYHFSAIVELMQKTISKYYNILNINSFSIESDSDQQFIILTLIYNYAGDKIPAAKHYLNRCKYRRLDKINMLNVICNSKVGLFNIVDFDKETRLITLSNIVTKEDIKIIDEGLSFTCEYQNYQDYILLARTLKFEDYHIIDGTCRLFKNNITNKLIKLYKDKKINDTQLLILGQAIEFK